MTDELDELAALCMAKVACPECLARVRIGARRGGKDCTCKGAAEILDPQLANLRLVLWVECDGKHVLPDGIVTDAIAAVWWRDENDKWWVPCGIVGCPGYVRRTWDMPTGALAGALIYSTIRTYVDETEHPKFWGPLFLQISNALNRATNDDSYDPDAEVVSVMLARLKVKA